MSEISLTPLKRTDCEDVQSIFNNKEIIAQLGGFAMLESIRQQVKPSGVSGHIAREGIKSIGAFQIGGRPQSHLLKLGSVGVLPEYRRRRISTTLYAAAIMQGVLEGRRLFEDTIVGDSPVQHLALPSMGLVRAGILKHKTASAKDIHIYQYDLIEADFNFLLSRINPDAVIYLHNAHYAEDLWNKNCEIMKKYVPSLIPKMEKCRELILQHPQIRIMQAEIIRGVNDKTKQPELLKTEDASV